MKLIDLMSAILLRLLIPAVGLMGIMVEELTGNVDSELLLVYTAMMGLSVPAIRDYLRGIRGEGDNKK